MTGPASRNPFIAPATGRVPPLRAAFNYLLVCALVVAGVSGGASGRFGVVFQASDKADSEYDGTDVGD